MKLYKIRALYLGKDLDDEVSIGYFTAEDETGAFLYINEHYGNWIESFIDEVEVEEDEEDKLDDAKFLMEKFFETEIGKMIMKDRGDFQDEYRGEFYDIKYGWEEVGEITEQEVQVLKKLKIL